MSSIQRVAALALTGALLFTGRPPAALAEAQSASCRLEVEEPFLYAPARVVIPVSSVQCDAESRRLRVVTALTRDGVVVAAGIRHAIVRLGEIHCKAPSRGPCLGPHT